MMMMMITWVFSPNFLHYFYFLQNDPHDDAQKIQGSASKKKSVFSTPLMEEERVERDDDGKTLYN